MRGTIEDFKVQLETCNKKGSWLVVENLQLLPEIDASLLIKEANEILEKGLVSTGFRCWIIYQLDSRVLDSSENGYSIDHLPLWFGVCYYVFLDESKSIAEELFHMNSPELETYSNKLVQTLTDQVLKVPEPKPQ